MSDKKWTALRPKGTSILSGPDGVIEADTLQCVHCGCHWQVQPGSGKRRGFCSRCTGPVCGPQCSECVPMERQLEIMEGSSNGTEVSASVIWTPGS